MTSVPGAGPVLLLLSAALLAFEIVLLRLFAIESFYHFAHMAIGVALLGFAASGTLLVVLRERVRPRGDGVFEILVVATAPALLLAPWLGHRVDFDATQLVWDPRQWGGLWMLFGSLTLPFLVGSGAIVLALDRGGERVGRLYGWNMVGSGLGTVLALVLLAVAPPERALAATVVVAAMAAGIAVLARAPSVPRLGVTALLLAGSVWFTAFPPSSLRITSFKGLPQVEAFPDAERVAEAFGPTGWAVAVRAPAFRHAPGLSLGYTGELPDQTALFVDGETAGAVMPWPPDGGAESFDWMPSAAAYAAGPARSVLVVGSGGGLEVAVALRHGVAEVTGLELVAPLAAVGQAAVGPDRWVYRAPGVRLVRGDARAFLARSEERFDRVILPPSGVFNATAAGIHSTGEDFLQTVDAHEAYFRRLAPGGVAALTRWLRVPARDNVKVILTAGEALRRMDVAEPGVSLVFLRSWATGTLLVKPEGFTAPELEGLRAFADARMFDVDWPPALTRDGPPFNALDAPVYRDAVSAVAEGPEAARSFARAFPFRVAPATDDRPYFGSFLRARSIPALLRAERGGWLPFAEWGTLAVLATLIQSGMLAVVLLGVPAFVLGRGRGDGEVQGDAVVPVGRVAAYFAAVGFGYVFIEIALIQRLGLVLGHPVYATAATLAGLLVFSGLGSAYSDGVPLRWLGRVCWLVGGVGLLVALSSPGIGALSGLPLAWRVAGGLVLVAVPGFVMGGPFALGLRAVGGAGGGVAWAWAANGIASVLGASLAVLLAIEAGGRVLVMAGAVCYGVAGLVGGGGRRPSIRLTVSN